MFRYLAAIGLSEYVEAGKLREFIGRIIRSPEQIKTAYLREGCDKMSVEKRVNMGPFFVTLAEKTGVAPEFTEIYPGVRELWGPVLEEIVIAEDNRGHLYVSGTENNTREPFTIMLNSLNGLIDKNGKITSGGIRKFSCYALSAAGTVLLGSEISDEDRENMHEEEEWRKDVLRRASEGEEAAFREIDSYMEEVDGEIKERLQSEDLYSVLDGFFSPVSPDGRYNVLGEILHVDKMMNPVTEEWVYRLEVKTMTVSLGLYINPRDLVGVPAKGRRFRGMVQLCGMADPDNLLDDADRGFF